jgi:hypothetical protein
VNPELAFFRLKSNQIDRGSFEKWLYGNSEIESLVSESDYLELISINYRTQSSVHDAAKLLEKYFSLADYHDWYLRRILEKILKRDKNVEKYIVECYDLYCDGYNFLDNIALGYGLGLSCPDEFNESVDDFYPAIELEAEKILSWLDDRKVVITGHSGQYLGIEYEDLRTAKEKRPTGYTVTKYKKPWWKVWS